MVVESMCFLIVGVLMLIIIIILIIGIVIVLFCFCDEEIDYYMIL